jgi:hypothetical protein
MKKYKFDEPPYLQQQLILLTMIGIYLVVLFIKVCHEHGMGTNYWMGGK